MSDSLWHAVLATDGKAAQPTVDFESLLFSPLGLCAATSPSSSSVHEGIVPYTPGITSQLPLAFSPSDDHHHHHHHHHQAHATDYSQFCDSVDGDSGSGSDESDHMFLLCDPASPLCNSALELHLSNSGGGIGNDNSPTLSSSPHDMFSSPSPTLSPFRVVPKLSSSSLSDDAAASTPEAAPVALAIVRSKAAAAAAAAAASEEPPKKRRRKRKRSDVDMLPTAVTLSRADLLKMTTEDLDHYEEQVRKTRDLTHEELQDIKRQRRLIKNRESAQQSRLRKKVQSDAIDNTLTDLAKENIRLTEQLAAKERENASLLQENKQLRNELAALKSTNTAASAAAAASVASSSFDLTSWLSIGPPTRVTGEVSGVCLMVCCTAVATTAMQVCLLLTANVSRLLLVRSSCYR
jgi:hypothetical protein